MIIIAKPNTYIRNQLTPRTFSYSHELYQSPDNTKNPIYMTQNSHVLGKYASVLFVVLLSIDRYIVMCLSNSRCRRFRNYRVAICASVLAVFIAIIASLPLFVFSGIVYHPNGARKLCVVKWPTINSPTW